MPVILLALPLIAILESFYPGKSTLPRYVPHGTSIVTQSDFNKCLVLSDNQAGVSSNVGTAATDNISNSAPTMIGIPNMPPTVNRSTLNPGHNYYRYTTVMGAGTAYILLCELGLLLLALVYGFGTTPVLAATALGLGCITPLIGLWATVLVSFPIELLASRKGRSRYLRVLQPANVVLISCVSGGLIFVFSFFGV